MKPRTCIAAKSLSLALPLALSAIGASSAFASPTFDPALQRYLTQQVPSGTRVQVIALLRDQQPVRFSARTSRLAVEEAMIRNANLSQKATLDRLAAAKARGIDIRVKPFWIVNAIAVDLPAQQLSALFAQDASIVTVLQDRQMHIVDAINPIDVNAADLVDGKYTYGLEKLGIPTVREKAPNITGEGIRVGVLDTGVDASHPDLKGKIVAWKDVVGNKNEPYDDHGHGTHVSGTIGGGNVSGTAIGVAPNVKILMGKIFTSAGSASTAGIMTGMQWMADPDGNPKTDDAPALVSNSWGGGPPRASADPAADPFCQATSAWLKLNILPVFAAGNSGPSAGSVGTPGACPGVLSVAATDSNDKVASFSSRGPVTWKTGSFTAPEVAAPGVDVISAKPGGSYQKMSGTSMATPHVAGLAALLKQTHPQLTAVEMIKAIGDGATPLGGGRNNNTGAGRIDAVKTLGVSAIIE